MLAKVGQGTISLGDAGDAVTSLTLQRVPSSLPAGASAHFPSSASVSTPPYYMPCSRRAYMMWLARAFPETLNSWGKRWSLPHHNFIYLALFGGIWGRNGGAPVTPALETCQQEHQGAQSPLCPSTELEACLGCVKPCLKTTKTTTEALVRIIPLWFVLRSGGTGSSTPTTFVPASQETAGTQNSAFPLWDLIPE